MARDDSTPLRSIGAGTSAGLSANSLTDSTAAFPVPDPSIGALGLIGLELNPNTAQSQTFTVVGNTATELFTDPADGDMTLVATAGDPSIGVYTFDNLTVIGGVQVVTDDDCEIVGTLDTLGGDPTCANLP